MGIYYIPSNNTNSDRSLSCCCCGFRFGWSAVIGILPVIGDILDLLIALSIIRTCMEVELPKHIVLSLNSFYADLDCANVFEFGD
jgi:hypothetical protein